MAKHERVKKRRDGMRWYDREEQTEIKRREELKEPEKN